MFSNDPQIHDRKLFVSLYAQRIKPSNGILQKIPCLQMMTKLTAQYGVVIERCCVRQIHTEPTKTRQCILIGTFGVFMTPNNCVRKPHPTLCQSTQSAVCSGARCIKRIL